MLGQSVINNHSIFFVDMINIGDDYSVLIVIGERKGSAGRIINVVLTSELVLSCYIPFSMSDGGYPFRAFFLRTGPNAWDKAFVPAYKPKKERCLRGQPETLFLQNEKGHLTIELFPFITERIIEWWTETLAGLDCFLVYDILSVDRGYVIFEMARCKSIQFYNIMLRSLHWFQVHNQKPSGILKNYFLDEMETFSPLPAVESRVMQAIRTAQFYKAEAKAFQLEIVRETFKKVGLLPWSPEAT